MRKFLTLLIIHLFVIPGALSQGVRNGVADVRDHVFSAGSPIVLSGSWEFYWNELLEPPDFHNVPPQSFLNVPGSWSRSGSYPALGFGTYRLRILLWKNHGDLSLYFPVINSSARIWINGRLAQELGDVGKDKPSSRAKLSGAVLSIPENSNEVEIVIQVSNFSYFSGGISGSPLLDRSSAIFKKLNRENGIENFFAGSLIAMCIYQLILYFLFHRGKPYLWLALICLGVALRALIVHGGSFLLPDLYPDVSFETWKKIEFGAVYAITALFPLYVRDLFSDYAPKKPIFVFTAVAAFMCLTVIVTPQYIYGKLLELAHVVLLFAFFYAVYSISIAWRGGNKDARIILFGVLASFPFILAEILKNSRFFPIDIHFMYLVEMGVLVFLLFQVYLLANHYASSYRNLENMNVHLERVVEERTSELIAANSVKDRLLSVMSHDLKSPLNSLRGIMQLYNKGKVTKDEFDDFAKHIETDLGKTSILVDNILQWTASQLKGFNVNMETLDVSHLINENVALFQTVASKKNVTIHYRSRHRHSIYSDQNILNLVLRNLLSNAIKFSHQHGQIEIEEQWNVSTLKILVIDHGTGMDQITREKLFDRQWVSKSGTGRERGTGLGLSLCRDFLEKANGGLHVESEPGKGSTFTIVLPVHQPEHLMDKVTWSTE